MTSYVQRVFRSVAPLTKNSLIKANEKISVMWALITMFCRVHFVFSFQLFFSSSDTFRLQRWSPRGHILKSLASKLQVLENCPVLGSRTAVFLESLKFCRSFFVEKLVFWRFFDFVFLRTPEKKFLKTLLLLFFWRTLAPVSLP